MAAPPQARPNTARHADRNAKIFNLRVAGLTVRQIAAEVELSPARVQEILTQEIGARVGPAAEEYVTLREAELSALWKRTFAIMATAEDADTRLKAVDRLVRINESRRKLRGADAPEAIALQLDRRVDEEATDVVTAVVAAVDALTAALPDLDGTFRAKLKAYALEVAGRALQAEGGAEPGPEPEAPQPQLALPPGSSAEQPAPPRFPRVPPTDPDAILDAARRLLEEDDDEE